MQRVYWVGFVSVVFLVIYLYTTRGRSLQEFITLLSQDDHTSGWINRGEFHTFNQAAKELNLEIGYGRVRAETGMQHYIKIGKK